MFLVYDIFVQRLKLLLDRYYKYPNWTCHEKCMHILCMHIMYIYTVIQIWNWFLSAQRFNLWFRSFCSSILCNVFTVQVFMVIVQFSISLLNAMTIKCLSYKLRHQKLSNECFHTQRVCEFHLEIIETVIVSEWIETTVCIKLRIQISLLESLLLTPAAAPWKVPKCLQIMI